MVRSVLLVAFLIGAFGSVWAAGTTTWTLRGTIGSYPVGVVLTLRDGGGVEAAHYFYASQLTDIPLSGSFDGKHLALKEPGGAAFDLALTGQSPTPPTSINQATAMAGSWTSKTQTLPVKLQMDASYPGSRTRWYGQVTDASDAEFEAMVRRFVSGVLNGKRDQTASAISYPLRVNGSPLVTIKTRRELLARWNSIFTPAYLAKLRKAVPHDMFVRNGEAMIGDGVAWFDAKGAKALNP